MSESHLALFADAAVFPQFIAAARLAAWFARNPLWLAVKRRGSLSIHAAIDAASAAVIY